MARLGGYLDLAAELQRPGERHKFTTTSGGDPDDGAAARLRIRASPAETDLARHRALVRRGSSVLPFLEVEGAAVHAEPHPAGFTGTVREDMAEMAATARALHFRTHHAV